MASFYICVKPTGSKFAKALQTTLKEKVKELVLRVDHEKTGRKTFVVTNKVLNKLEQMNAFATNNTPCPSFCEDAGQVGILGKRVFARTLLSGTNGRGIIEFEPGHGETPQAPLYTAYIPKKAEYRVHFFDGQVIDTQQKKKKHGTDNTNTHIRNLQNGYVYCRDGINPPTDLSTCAISAVNAVGYSYGAVDVIWNEKQNKCFVLEVNSRPGLEGTTLDKYADSLINKFNLTRK